MKFATNPRRRTEAAMQDQPDQQGQCRRGPDERGGITVGCDQRQLRSHQDRDGRRRGHAEDPGSPQQGVDHRRHQGGVEAHLDRQPRDRGVRHRLRNDDGRCGEAGNDIEPEPFLPVADGPLQDGKRRAALVMGSPERRGTARDPHPDRVRARSARLRRARTSRHRSGLSASSVTPRARRTAAGGSTGSGSGAKFTATSSRWPPAPSQANATKQSQLPFPSQAAVLSTSCQRPWRTTGRQSTSSSRR